MCRSLLLVSLSLIMAGCSAPSVPEQASPYAGADCEGLDLTESYEPMFEGGLQLHSPVLQIPARSEILWCYFDRFEDSDFGVHDVIMRSSAEGLMHHAVLKRVDDDQYPDGTLIDCTAAEEQSIARPPLFEIGQTEGLSWFNLPDGFAYKVEANQRYAADIHYINLTDDDICINVAWDLETLPSDEVETFVGAFNLDIAEFEVPTGGLHTESFDCAWPKDLGILSLSGHMHFFGSHYSIDWLAMDERVYEVDDWLPEYRFSSPIVEYAPGEFDVAEGDVFRSSCTWDNTSGNVLGYPQEMCTTYGIAYPLEEPLLCSNGEWVSTGATFPEGGSGPATVAITLKSSAVPTGDGQGDVYVLAFEGPNTGPPNEPVAQSQTFNVNLASPESTAVIQLEGVPVESDITIIGYLDDDDSGWKNGPSPGDLFGQTDGISVVKSPPMSVELVLDSTIP